MLDVFGGLIMRLHAYNISYLQPLLLKSITNHICTAARLSGHLNSPGIY